MVCSTKTRKSPESNIAGVQVFKNILFFLVFLMKHLQQSSLKWAGHLYVFWNLTPPAIAGCIARGYLPLHHLQHSVLSLVQNNLAVSSIITASVTRPACTMEISPVSCLILLPFYEVRQDLGTSTRPQCSGFI